MNSNLYNAIKKVINKKLKILHRKKEKSHVKGHFLKRIFKIFLTFCADN